MVQRRDRVEVAAGILRNSQGDLLLTQRRHGTHLGGSWEFPGGKIEKGETADCALRRELDEELGVQIGNVEPLISVPWSYDEKDIVLHALCVGSFTGEPFGRERQLLRWTALQDMTSLSMPPADRPIVTALRLPRSYAITAALSGNALLSCIDALCAGGERLVQLRAKHVPASSLVSIARQAALVARSHGAAVLLNGNLDLVRELDLDGVHLPAAELLAQTSRPLDASRWVGASCHDERELVHAAAIGADFAVVGPVLPTRSHAQAPPLGWERFAALCAAAPFPVYALGGMTRQDIPAAIAAGAQGIAGISAFAAY